MLPCLFVCVRVDEDQAAVVVACGAWSLRELVWYAALVRRLAVAALAFAFLFNFLDTSCWDTYLASRFSNL